MSMNNSCSNMPILSPLEVDMRPLAHRRPADTTLLVLEADGRQLQYAYAYHEAHVADVVDEILFLSPEQRKMVLSHIRQMKHNLTRQTNDA